MWGRSSICVFKGPCARRLDILSGPKWTSKQTEDLKMWGPKPGGIHRTLWVDPEHSTGAGASLHQVIGQQVLCGADNAQPTPMTNDAGAFRALGDLSTS